MSTLNCPQPKDGDDPLYAVYIYHRPSNENFKNNNWERKALTKDLRMAKLKAKSLHRSQRYDKVELQKTHYGPDLHEKNNKIVKVYDQSPDYTDHIFGFTALFVELMLLCGYLMFIYSFT